MKKLLFMIGTMLAFSAYGQSKLPPCPKIDVSIKTDPERYAKWHNCWGRYKVEFKDGFKGDVLEGEWRNGDLNGQGTYTYVMGDNYVGEFKYGEKTGQGIYTWRDGSKHVGAFIDGIRNGHGTYIDANGDKYVGEFKDGNPHGRGIQTYVDGSPSQEGIWADAKFVRAVKINLAIPEELNLPYQQPDLALNEERHRLEAAQNTQSNLRPCKGPDATKWSNCFGTYSFTSGTKYVGDYKDGKYHGQGTFTFSSGEKYVGEFKDGRPSGRASHTFPSGNNYVGEYKDGKMHGQGTFTWSDGGKYAGEYKDGKKNGQGIFAYADGRVEEGIWADDKFVRAEKITPPSQQTDLALNEERRRLEADRQALAEDRRRLDEERRNREQARTSQRINLNVTHTPPDAEGDFTISIQANTDTASVKINGEELGGREDGQYTVRKVARAGKETIFTIKAKDLNGNTESKSITVSRGIVESSVKFAALNPTQVKRQPARDAVAIIIGIADYTNLPKAEYANDDARAFYDYAIRGLGVKAENIKLLIDTDADEIAIYQAFKTWLPSRVRSTTDVYVYYSGHGLPAADGQGLYLLPLGAHRDLIEKTAISQQEINGYLQLAKPKSVTIFLDSCYSGLTRTGQTLVASARPLSLKAETKIFPPNFTVISASQSDQISSSSPDLQHGIFSYYLMKGMEGDADTNRDGKITLGEMLEYLTEQVARQASMVSRKQQPQLLGDANKVLVGQR